MHRFIFDDDGGFLIVETKFGNLRIEQWDKGTSVKFIENPEGFTDGDISTHIEDNSYNNVKVISMVQDE